MEKEVGKIKVTETDDGYRIEITGKDLKDKFGCCCIPCAVPAGGVKMECCPSESEKK
jgi:hypothetical protein